MMPTKAVSSPMRAWPTLMFVDPRGKVIARHEGEFEADRLTPIMEQMLAEAEAKA